MFIGRVLFEGVHKSFKKINKDNIKTFFHPGIGFLSWRRVIMIASRNLIKNRSRSFVTVGGVTVGIGAIVLLVSFGYGLQELVTSRIIWPEALRVTEASVENSSIKLNRELLEKMKGLNGVVETAPVVRMVGEVVFNNSKIDAVVVGVTRNYLKMSNTNLVAGKELPENFDKRFLGEGDFAKIVAERETKGEVAGVSTETELIKNGDLINKEIISFKIKDDVYVPVKEEAKETAKLMGYFKGSILERREGQLVWGGVYDNLGGEGRVYTPNGQVMGKWIKTKMTLYQKVQDGVYEVIGEKEGYISLDKVNILSPGEIQVEKIMESGMVLGEATGSGIITDVKDLSMVSIGTQAASLVKMLSGTEVSALGDTIPDLKVTSEAEKIILISKSLARAWNKEPKDLINQEVSLTYLMTGALANQAWGRVKSEKTTYKIGGVFEDSGKPMIYAPLGDVESLGVENYSGIKILVDKEENLGIVRTLIQSMGLVTRSVADTLGQINRLFGVVRFLLGAFGSIALTVALFGMFNTLTVSLLERTREIGVMKSLGTSNMDVVRIFLTEAVMISTVGGIGGVLFGLSIGKIIDLFVFRFNNNTNEMFVLPWLFVLGIILVAFGVGLITGWYPSRRASKISALNALRYE